MEELMNLQFTSMTWSIIAPLVFMGLDILTGFLGAWKNKEVASSKMRDGLGKKCAELCYIVVGAIFKFAFGIDAILYFMVFYVIYMELVSLAENCDKLGVPMPEVLKEKLNANSKKED